MDPLAFFQIFPESMKDAYTNKYTFILIKYFKKIDAVFVKALKVQSRKSYNNRYMIFSAQITNTDFFAFIAVLVFKLLSREVLLINRKDNRNS